VESEFWTFYLRLTP